MICRQTSHPRAVCYNRFFLQQLRRILVSQSGTAADPARARLHQSHLLADLPKIVVEQPPKVEFGEYALPLAFELAKKLRKAPRKIAEEITGGIGPIPGFEKLELAGAGYINARLKRGDLAATLVADDKRVLTPPLARFWLSIPALIPTRLRTSAICETPSSATPLSGC